MPLRTSRSFLVATAVAVIAPMAGLAAAGPLAGRWDATVTANDVVVPFVFVIEGTDAAPTGVFFNGDRRTESTPGQVQDGTLVLEFPQDAGATLRAEVRGDELIGEYRRGSRGAPLAFRAQRAAAPQAGAEAANVPSIEGTWIVSAAGKRNEGAWRLIARQTGADVEATLLRVDGDTGTLTGRYRDGRFVLSHFSGARPLLLEITPETGETLTLRQNGRTDLRAAREGTAAAAAIGTPVDPSVYTSVRNPQEPLRFSFPDLDGRVVSNEDPRFRDKVVIVSISGSWCPNCHDEAPFLARLYRDYRARGLEIVTLAFEEEEQLANPERLRAFIAQYGFEHTVLLAGEPDQLQEKLPQGQNLDAFPTTFLLGRDGRIRAVHTGFPSPGSADYYTKAEATIIAEVERLLAEPAQRSH